jgi:adenosylcobinamide-GDP ribazoletransferase
VGALSRVPMIAIMALLSAARPGGLSRSVGRPGRATLWLGIAIGLGLAALFAGPASLMLALVTGAAGLTAGLIARAKIGGQTGDILGASQQLAEIAALATLASLWRVV